MNHFFLCLDRQPYSGSVGRERGQKNGLKSSDEFKELSQGIPLEGNQFFFISQKFGSVITDIQKQALVASTGKTSAPPSWIRQFTAFGQPSFTFSVTANTEEGPSKMNPFVV